MYKVSFMKAITTIAASFLVACSGDGENDITSSSQFNPDLQTAVSTGEPGGDISPIAGLWDGTISNVDANDVVYWNFAANGVLTRFDFQQDGGLFASGENCYIVSDPITVTPEGGSDYSIDNVAVTAVVDGESLDLTFLEADTNDLDENGDAEETPSFKWTRLTSPVLEDLNSCTLSTDVADPQNNVPDESDNTASDGPLNPFIPDPPDDAVSLSTFFNGSFDGESMVGGGITFIERAGTALRIRGLWGNAGSYYEVDMFVSETTDGTYQLDSNSGVVQIVGLDAVAASFSASGEGSDTVTFVWDKDAGLISGSFEFTAVDDRSRRVNVSGEFNTRIREDAAWHCNFDDEIINICWFVE